MSRKNKNGLTNSQTQSAHNVRDKKAGQLRADVLYTFGRTDSPDGDAVRRLTRNLSTFFPLRRP